RCSRFSRRAFSTMAWPARWPARRTAPPERRTRRGESVSAVWNAVRGRHQACVGLRGSQARRMKGTYMTGDTATRASSAHVFPLTIRELLLTGVRRAPDQQIVCADNRLTYREFEERIGRLASALDALGVGHGHTVAVMDWDTNRYLECFFAVPMMGAVLHTVNVRLSPEQVLYTINHAPDDLILVNGEFLPMLEDIWERVVPGKKLVLMLDSGADVTTSLRVAGEFEALLAAADP